jgi:hypothetical protein
MQAHAQSGRSSGHESSKAPLKSVLWCLAGFIATAVLIHLILISYGLILRNIHKGFGRIYQVPSNQVLQYPKPALQDNPQVDLQIYRFQAEHDLNTYGWIDEAHGIVKIPINRAMERLVAKGFPVRPAIQDGPTQLDMQNQKAAADAPSIVPQQPRPYQP